MSEENGETSRTDVQEARAELRQLIEEKMTVLGLESLQDFADHYDIGRSTLYELVRGRSRTRGAWVRPRLETLIALAHALEKPLHVVLYLVEPDAPGALESNLSNCGDVLALPVQIAGWAGAGPEQAEAASNLPPVYVSELMARGRSLSAFLIRGDSMARGKRPIHDGDRVVVDLDDKGFNTASVVAQLSDGSYVCKMLKDDKFGRWLQSRNPEHTNGTPTILALDDEARIVGRVIQVIGEDDSTPSDGSIT